MKIRSITYFCNPKFPLEEKIVRKAGTFLTEARSAYETAGYEVQTVRLATIPFPKLLGAENIDKLPALTGQLADIAKQLNIGYFSLGPALPEMPRSYQVIPDAIFVSKDAFFGGVMAGKTDSKSRDGATATLPESKIHLAAIRACADVIVKSAPIEPNGFANLQFAALANVPAGAPFFPAAYHDKDIPYFGIATESADLAVQAFENAKTIEEGRNHLVSEIEKHGKKLAEIAKTLKVKFYGVDFSLAPFPDDAHSLGNAVEKMGIPKIGLHGSLAAAAILTEAVDRADFPHTGFSGFMQPVLEDSVLAKRAAEGTLTIKDALLYSAVCGTGLDTVPLPGDTTTEQLVPLLLDLSALALRLEKPLTARLMPVPGKKAGDETNFDFGFFSNSRVMDLVSQPLREPFNELDSLSLRARSLQSR